jgi:hypothetical protein
MTHALGEAPVINLHSFLSSCQAKPAVMPLLSIIFVLTNGYERSEQEYKPTPSALDIGSLQWRLPQSKLT